MIDWRFAAIKIVNVFAYRARIRFNMQQYMFLLHEVEIYAGN